MEPLDFFTNVIVFLVNVLEWDRKIYPEIDFELFWYSDNLNTNLIIAIMNACIELIDNRVVYPIENEPFISDFLTEFKVIKKEFNRYSKFYYPVSFKVFDNSIVDSTQHNDYFYYICRYYRDIDRISKHFPVLNRLLNKYQYIRTAFFSAIKGPLAIKTHRGPYRGLLRGHIAIHTDEPESSVLNIMDDTYKYNWREGNAFIFDDTYYHRLDKTDELSRISFIFDIKRNFTQYPSVNILNDYVIDTLSDSEYVKSCFEKL